MTGTTGNVTMTRAPEQPKRGWPQATAPHNLSARTCAVQLAAHRAVRCAARLCRTAVPHGIAAAGGWAWMKCRGDCPLCWPTPGLGMQQSAAAATARRRRGGSGTPSNNSRYSKRNSDKQNRISWSVCATGSCVSPGREGAGAAGGPASAAGLQAVRLYLLYGRPGARACNARPLNHWWRDGTHTKTPPPTLRTAIPLHAPNDEPGGNAAARGFGRRVRRWALGSRGVRTGPAGSSTHTHTHRAGQAQQQRHKNLAHEQQATPTKIDWKRRLESGRQVS